MPASKADQVQKEKRILQCVNALLDGYPVQRVAIQMQEDYGVSQAQAYTYTKEATTRIHQKIQGELSDNINKHYQRLERLYNKCVQDGDKRTARMVLKDMADLLGLDAPKRTDITTGGEKLATFVDVLGVANEEEAKDEPVSGKDTSHTEES